VLAPCDSAGARLVLIPCRGVASAFVSGDVGGDPTKGVVHYENRIGLVLAQSAEIEAKLRGAQT